METETETVTGTVTETVRVGPHTELLVGLGRAVRARRQSEGSTLKVLAARARVSERFLAQLETGAGNISVSRLYDVATALGTTAAALLAEAERPSGRAPGIIALLGLRGAGKSAVGSALAARLGVGFIELDARIEQAAGMPLATLFELHGTTYYRRLEREALTRVLAGEPGTVLATGGSVVTDAETYALLRSRTTTVWLRATAEEHWRRVVAQGDARPMANRSNAMAELTALLRARTPLYARAKVTVDTSALGIEATVEALVTALAGARGATAQPAVAPKHTAVGL